MQLTETVKLYPSKKQREKIKTTMIEYITAVNQLVEVANGGTSIAKYSSKHVDAELPSALRCQCAQDARSIVKKHYKFCKKAILKNRSSEKRGSDIRVTAPKLPVLKKPCCYINNQNFKVTDNCIEFPVMLNGKSTRIAVPTRMATSQKEAFSNNKLGTMRIVVKGKSIVAQIVYEVDEQPILENGSFMGVDLGIKCPAVSYSSDGSVNFYGNG